MRFVTLAAGALAFTLVGFASCLLLLRLQSEGRIHFTLLEIRGQVSGDPPVTVSDGSLYARSWYDWQADDTSTPGRQVIAPQGKNGQPTLQQTCPTPNKAAAILWTGGASGPDYPIDPEATVTVTTPDAVVTIKLPKLNETGLTISTEKASFSPSGFWGPVTRFKRMLTGSGDVSSIEISSPPNTWVRPSTDTTKRKFTLGFCYKSLL